VLPDSTRRLRNSVWQGTHNVACHGTRTVLCAARHKGDPKRKYLSLSVRTVTRHHSSRYPTVMHRFKLVGLTRFVSYTRLVAALKGIASLQTIVRSNLRAWKDPKLTLGDK